MLRWMINQYHYPVGGNKMRQMRCPYCKALIDVTDDQIANNLRFKCPVCHKYNEGSAKSDANGILIGVSIEELKRQCRDFPTGFPK